MPKFNEKDIDISIESESTDDVGDNVDKKLADEWSRKEKGAFHHVKMISIYFIPIVACIVIIVYFFNILSPEKYRWLTMADIAEIRGIVISVIAGVSTSLAINYFYRK